MLTRLFNSNPVHLNVVLPSKHIINDLNSLAIGYSNKTLDYEAIAMKFRTPLVSYTHRDSIQYNSLCDVTDIFYKYGMRRLTIYTNRYSLVKLESFLNHVKKFCKGLFIKFFVPFDNVSLKKIERKEILRLNNLSQKLNNFSLQGYLIRDKRLSKINAYLRSKLHLKTSVFPDIARLRSDKEYILEFMHSLNIISKSNENINKDKITLGKYPMSSIRRSLGVLNGEAIVNIITKKWHQPACIAGSKSLFIDCIGNVYPCPYKNPIGTIWNYSVRIKKRCDNFCGWGSYLQLSMIHDPIYLFRMIKKIPRFIQKV
jgi:hypothetical protein